MLNVIIIDLLGSGFSFATSDIVTKIKNLKDRRNEYFNIGKLQGSSSKVTIQVLN